MTLTSKPLAFIVIAILFSGIFISDRLGWWETESTKIAATYSEGDFAGQANPADIRGSYTFGDVENNFGISPTVLAEAFAIQTDDPAAFQVKNLETMYENSEVEIGTSSVRLFVAFYKNLPYDLSTDIYLPESAAAILHQQALTTEQANYLEAHMTATNLASGESAPQAEATPEAQVEATIAPQPETTPDHTPVSGDGSVRGKTTFGELLNWGLTQADIEAILGMPMPASPSMTVKDFCSANGLSFETINTDLQVAIDTLP